LTDLLSSVGRYGGYIAASLSVDRGRPVPLTCTLYRLLSRSGTRQSGKLTSFDCICKASLSYRNYRILPMCGLPMCIYIRHLCVSASLSLDFFVSELELLLIALRLQHSVRVWVIIPNTHTTHCTAFFFLAAFPFYFSFRKTCNTFRLSSTCNFMTTAAVS